METETLIVGAGLSGLSFASHLAAQGKDYLIVEARDRLGGRIMSEQVDNQNFDLGPAWFWPGQPRIADLIQKLNLTVFDQYADGDLMFEDERGQVQRGHGFASMQGSYRLQGSLSNLIDALSRTLETSRINLNMPVTSITQTGNRIETKTQSGKIISARHCVLALPPRVAATLTFAPSLPEPAIKAMNSTATWMAGQAKAIAVYDKPFWREAGLSGDAMSRAGPMVEIHDASPANEENYALFGFIGVPPNARKDKQLLRQQISLQLERLFGAKATNPIKLLLKDWAYDPYTSTQLDLQPLYAHPQYGLPHALSDLWNGRLIFAGTEVAPRYGGYLEGALEASENALKQLSEERV